MANIEIRFLCDSKDGSYITAKNLINPCVDIVIVDKNNDYHEVILDKSTAIKFAKTLRTEINKVKEGQNG